LRCPLRPLTQNKLPNTSVNFVLTKELRLLKVTGSSEGMSGGILTRIQEDFDQCILALASFKDADAVGIDGFRVLPAQLLFGALAGESHYFSNQYIPLGTYLLSGDETGQLAAHAALFANLHSSLEMAVGRLVDSTHRIKDRDAIVDAIIGLESILLHKSPHT